MRGLRRSYTEGDKNGMINNVFDFRHGSSPALIRRRLCSQRGTLAVVVFNLSIETASRSLVRHRVCSCHASTTALELCGLQIPSYFNFQDSRVGDSWTCVTEEQRTRTDRLLVQICRFFTNVAFRFLLFCNAFQSYFTIWGLVLYTSNSLTIYTVSHKKHTKIVLVISSMKIN